MNNFLDEYDKLIKEVFDSYDRLESKIQKRRDQIKNEEKIFNAKEKSEIILKCDKNLTKIPPQ